MRMGNPFFRIPPHGNKKVPPSLTGYFLISETYMSDPNFFQTVVLVLEHNQEGAFGLIVNHRSKITLGDIVPKLSDQYTSNTPVYVGGPVQQEYLFAVHSEMPGGHHSSDGVIQPLKGVIFEPSFYNLQSYFEAEKWNDIPIDDQPKIHLFLGYSGWAPGQLEKELQLGSWLFHPAHPKIIFHPRPEEGWSDALRQKGGIYKVFANSKQNPNLN